MSDETGQTPSEPLPTEISERSERAAYGEWVRRYGGIASFDEVHRRGGFTVMELIDLLTDRVEWLEGSLAVRQDTE